MSVAASARACGCWASRLHVRSRGKRCSRILARSELRAEEQTKEEVMKLLSTIAIAAILCLAASVSRAHKDPGSCLCGSQATALIVCLVLFSAAVVAVLQPST